MWMIILRQNFFSFEVWKFKFSSTSCFAKTWFPCPVSWCCRIYQLHLCRRVKPLPLLQRVFWLWHLTIWWWGSSNTGALGNTEHPSIAILPGPLWPRGVAPDRVLSMGRIELKCILMQNWITWNRTVLTFNCVWTKSILILNWIVWISSV